MGARLGNIFPSYLGISSSEYALILPVSWDPDEIIRDVCGGSIDYVLGKPKAVSKSSSPLPMPGQTGRGQSPFCSMLSLIVVVGVGHNSSGIETWKTSN
jgi:hypothetical protein